MATQDVRDGKTMKSFRCKHCHRSLPADPRVKDQQYCSQADCQAARKKAWLRKKMATDPDYVENQCLAQKKWRENHPGYWRNYRKKHPKPPPAASDPQDAKMDAIRTYLNDSSNIYDLVPIFPDGVKIDAIRVKIIPVSGI